MTTSLATYLRSGYDCDLLVPGIKEPWIFSSDPAEADRIVRHRVASNPRTGMFLDASTSYGPSPAALNAIVTEGLDYRIIVCLRNQFERVVSAYKYYRAIMTIALDTLDPGPDAPQVLAALGQAPGLKNSFLRSVACSYYRAFGIVPTEFFGPDLGLWMAQSRDCSPSRFVAAPVGKYSGTSILAAVMGTHGMPPAVVMEADRECALFATQSLPARVMYEMRHLRMQGKLPCLNILGNSFFAPTLENLLATVDPARVLLLSMETAAGSPALAATLAAFLDCPARTPGVVFPKSNDSARQAAVVTRADLKRADLLLRDALVSDSADLNRLVARFPHLRHPLFVSDKLYAGNAVPVQ